MFHANTEKLTYPWIYLTQRNPQLKKISTKLEKNQLSFHVRFKAMEELFKISKYFYI